MALRQLGTRLKICIKIKICKIELSPTRGIKPSSPGWKLGVITIRLLCPCCLLIFFLMEYQKLHAFSRHMYIKKGYLFKNWFPQFTYDWNFVWWIDSLKNWLAINFWLRRNKGFINQTYIYQFICTYMYLYETEA